jgi:hypothetical protein
VIGPDDERIVRNVLEDALECGVRILGRRKPCHRLAFGVVPAAREFANESGSGLEWHIPRIREGRQKDSESPIPRVCFPIGAKGTGPVPVPLALPSARELRPFQPFCGIGSFRRLYVKTVRSLPES